MWTKLHHYLAFGVSPVNPLQKAGFMHLRTRHFLTHTEVIFKLNLDLGKVSTYYSILSENSLLACKSYIKNRLSYETSMSCPSKSCFRLYLNCLGLYNWTYPLHGATAQARFYPCHTPVVVFRQKADPTLSIGRCDRRKILWHRNG